MILLQQSAYAANKNLYKNIFPKKKTGEILQNSFYEVIPFIILFLLERLQN